MAFAPQDFAVLAYSNGFTLWHYGTEDASVTEADYFNGAAPYVRIGDVMICSLARDGVSPTAQILTVAAVTADRQVTVAPLRAAG